MLQAQTTFSATASKYSNDTLLEHD